MSGLLSLAEMAVQLHLTEAYVKALVDRHEIPVCWVERQPFFIPSHVTRWLDGLSDGTTTVFPPGPPEPDEPAPCPDPHIKGLGQRTDGRWSGQVLCPDGVIRMLVSRKAEYVKPEHLKRRTRQGLSAHDRFSIFQRDAFTCRYCGRKAPKVTLHVDHVVSVKDGGTDDIDNLVTACSDCNHGKGGRSV